MALRSSGLASQASPQRRHLLDERVELPELDAELEERLRVAARDDRDAHDALPRPARRPRGLDRVARGLPPRSAR